MFIETLESRQLCSATTDITPTTDQSQPAGQEPPAIVELRKSSGGNTSGQFYLVFTFKLVAVKS